MGPAMIQIVKSNTIIENLLYMDYEKKIAYFIYDLGITNINPFYAKDRFEIYVNNLGNKVLMEFYE